MVGEVSDISLDIVPRLPGRMNMWRNTIYHRDIGNPTSLAAAISGFPCAYLAFRNPMDDRSH
jgi:hypothetical protein